MKLKILFAFCRFYVFFFCLFVEQRQLETMSGDASFDTSSPCAWVSLMTFMACIACVILMPPVPIFPRWSHIKKLYNRLRRGRQMQQIFDEEPPHVTVVRVI